MNQHGNPKLLHKEGNMTRDEAVQREKRIKGWTREKKLNFIQEGPETAR
jgi:predicted GIY-YIG superfamily endonuclease